MLIYAISDIHGCTEELDSALKMLDLSTESGNMLILLGDYIHRGPDSVAVLDRLFRLKKKLGRRMVMLRGNHEQGAINNTLPFSAGGDCEKAAFYLSEFEKMPLYYHHKETDTVFVHAGLNENEGREKRLENNESRMLWQDYTIKSTAPFNRIIAGHTPTTIISGRPSFNGPCHENNHYYIDGHCYHSGVLNVVAVSEDGAVNQVVSDGLKPIPYLPISFFNYNR